MQAITTKLLPPTNFRGTRIVARCAVGSLTIPYPYEKEGSSIDVFAVAAMALVRKLGWVKNHPETDDRQNGYVGAWVGGQTVDGCRVFCFAFGVEPDVAHGVYGADFGEAPAVLPFTVFHINDGAVTVDHVTAVSADAALDAAKAQDMIDPVVFAGHLSALASE